MNTQIKEAVISSFQRLYDQAPTHLVSAPGRVNLIGEHTDYNEGFVLPCALDFATYIAIGTSREQDQHLHIEPYIEVCALDYDQAQVRILLNEPFRFDEEHRWSNYIRGVIAVFQAKGVNLNAVSMVISGDVPQGAGLSSSASLEVAVGLALSTYFQLNISPKELALIGQKAENEYVGCQCGIMDQMVSACAQEGHASLIDCRNLELTHIPLPKDLALVIIHSGVKRELVESEYNTRREECQTACNYLGVQSLRDATIEQLEVLQDRMPEQIFKRARHVISENQRTLEAVQFLKYSVEEEVICCMTASHYSLQHDYEVSTPELDLLTLLINQMVGSTGGSRMTGGGFGGCVVALIPHDRVSELNDRVLMPYQFKTELRPTLYLCKAGPGARVLSL